MPEPLRRALAKLTDAQRVRLQLCLDDAIEPVPTGWHRFSLNGHGIGWLDPQRAALAETAFLNASATVQRVPGVGHAPHQLNWLTAHADSGERSQVLARVAQGLRDTGAISGWRDELYALPGDGLDAHNAPELFRLERAAFRFFGLRSRAAHINGYTAEGRLWIGRRAISKAVDPGLLDNLAAGGLPAGEDVRGCAMRELWEEAGVAASIAAQIEWCGSVTTHRPVADGLHHEDLTVFNLLVSDACVPVNQDGEVSGFECLSLPEVIAHIDAGQMTADAAAVTAFALLG